MHLKGKFISFSNYGEIFLLSVLAICSIWEAIIFSLVFPPSGMDEIASNSRDILLLSLWQAFPFRVGSGLQFFYKYFLAFSLLYSLLCLMILFSPLSSPAVTKLRHFWDAINLTVIIDIRIAPYKKNSLCTQRSHSVCGAYFKLLVEFYFCSDCHIPNLSNNVSETNWKYTSDFQLLNDNHFTQSLVSLSVWFKELTLKLSLFNQG